MTAPKNYDPVTTKAMLDAYDLAETTYRDAITTVDNLIGERPAHWKGGAGTTFGNGLASWRSGIADVKAGFDGLNAGMAGYRRNSNTSEDDNTGVATDWHTGGPGGATHN